MRYISKYSQFPNKNCKIGVNINVVKYFFCIWTLRLQAPFPQAKKFKHIFFYFAMKSSNTVYMWYTIKGKGMYHSWIFLKIYSRLTEECWLRLIQGPNINIRKNNLTFIISWVMNKRCFLSTMYYHEKSIVHLWKTEIMDSRQLLWQLI